MSAVFAGVHFLAGALFAAGLCLSGMTSPARVVGFLDLGAWDPSLLYTMAGAVSVSALGWRLRSRMRRPLGGGAFPGSAARQLDGRLFAGAALFGVGWGLGGFCPGPALASLGGALRPALVFIPAMVGGMLLFQLVDRRRPQPIGSAAETSPKP